MRQYLDLMRHVLEHGTPKPDRTGTGTLSVFGHQMRFDLAAGFPMVTTKKLHMRSIIHELLWFLKGETNTRYLKENGVSIWDEWARADGELGPVYGHQWRSWPAPSADNPNAHIDQITEVMRQLKQTPDSRRIIVSAWNVADIPKMALAPCHALFQFYVAPASSPAPQGSPPPQGSPAPQGSPPARGKLSCQLYQRSADIFLGVPFNIASYALLTHMVAQQCDLAVGDFVWTGGDCHLYSNHLDQTREQLARSPYGLPQLSIKRRPDTLFDYRYEDFDITGYQSHAHIKAPVAV